MPNKFDYNGFKLETGEITFLTFNHPKINIFSTAVLKDIVNAFEIIYSLDNIKVLVIACEGKNFLAGANIKEMYSFTPTEATEFSKLFHKVFNLVEGFPMPVIASVNGFALGGGCELVLACDLVIASESAVFGQPEIDIGVIPGAGGTQRLTARIGKLRAKDLIFTGRKVPAQEALSLGMINKVVAENKLLDETIELAKIIASKPLHCLKSSKMLINSGSMDKEIEEFSKMFSYDDRIKLMSKFVKK